MEINPEYRLQDSTNLLLMVMTPNVERIYFELEEFLSKRHKKRTIQSYFVGIGFGRYDLIAEIQGSNIMKAFACARDFQRKVLAKIPMGCISPISCHRLTRYSSLSQEKPRPNYPIRSYTFFRMDETNIGDIISLAETSKRQDGLLADVFWNRSMYSYVLRVQSRKFDDLLDMIYAFRKSGGFLKDFCTFVAKIYGEEDEPAEKAIKAQINVKVHSQQSIDNVFRKFPNTVYRLGHFDLIVNEERKTLHTLSKQILELRRILEQRSYLDRTATILLFEKPKSELNEEERHAEIEK